MAPRADKMAPDQNTSPNSAGIYSNPPIRGPYLSWKGSIMVMYSLWRKRSPPARKKYRQICVGNREWVDKKLGFISPVFSEETEIAEILYV